MNCARAWMALCVGCAGSLLACGSQQLRLTAPETAAGNSYTCTAANTCYPASLATPVEGQTEQALPLQMPRECQGRIHEILIRNPDSSSPEIDVTCAVPERKAPAKAAANSAHDPVDTSGIDPLP